MTDFDYDISARVGRQIGPNQFLGHVTDRAGNARYVSLLKLEPDRSVPEQARHVRKAFAVHQESGDIYAVSELKPDAVEKPRIRASNDSPSTVADILLNRTVSAESAKRAPWFQHIRMQISKRRNLALFVAGFACICGIAVTVVSLAGPAPTPAGPSNIALASPVPADRGQVVEEEQDGEVKLSQHDRASREWFESILIKKVPNSVETQMRKVLAWTPGSEIATRLISQTGDMALFALCAIDTAGKDHCVHVVVESDVTGLGVRQIMMPTT